MKKPHPEFLLPTEDFCRTTRERENFTCESAKWENIYFKLLLLGAKTFTSLCTEYATLNHTETRNSWKAAGKQQYFNYLVNLEGMARVIFQLEELSANEQAEMIQEEGLALLD